MVPGVKGFLEFSKCEKLNIDILSGFFFRSLSQVDLIYSLNVVLNTGCYTSSLELQGVNLCAYARLYSMFCFAKTCFCKEEFCVREGIVVSAFQLVVARVE
jgi:hypothetical protein